MLRNLYASHVEVFRLAGTLVAGTPTLTWFKVTDILDPILGVPGEFLCRLDMAFIRPGKDAPMPAVAGRAPDAIGTMYLDPTPHLKAGDRLHTITGPVHGTYEIRATPDVAVAYATAHHMEVQVIEVAQALAGVFPGAEVTG